MRFILPNVLALDVGAKRIGAAVFENQRLVFRAIKTFKKTNEAETLLRLRAVLKRLIADYGIQVIALETLAYPQQQKSFVKVVYKEVRKLANERKIQLSEFEPILVRRVVCKNKPATKQNVFEIITSLYPELSKTFAAQRVWQKAYYAYLFNAIAVGLVSVKEIKENNSIGTIRKNFENEDVRKNAG